MAEMGTVKFFNSEKGYGFIKPDSGGADIFVHISAVQASGLPGLTENQKVSYETEPDRRGKGPKAVNLTVVGSDRFDFDNSVEIEIDQRIQLPVNAVHTHIDAERDKPKRPSTAISGGPPSGRQRFIFSRPRAGFFMCGSCFFMCGSCRAQVAGRNRSVRGTFNSRPEVWLDEVSP